MTPLNRTRMYMAMCTPGGVLSTSGVWESSSKSSWSWAAAWGIWRFSYFCL